ncbi:MAG: DsbA family protein [Myxococcales bacterium]|nr:DsbA family protein [Myxococcales bacterium]
MASLLPSPPDPVPETDVYFDVVCPFAYLAMTQVVGREGFRWRPILLGGLLKDGGTSPNPWGQPSPGGALPLSPDKRAYIQKDAERHAALYGVPLRWHPDHPVRSLLPMRALVALCEHDDDGIWLPPQHHHVALALYRAYWIENQNLSVPETLTAALDAAGVPGATLVAAAATDAIKAALTSATAAAAERGVFGVPTFERGGALAFGQDRLWDVLGEGRLWPAPAPSSRPDATLDFWYDFASPFAYMGALRVQATAQRAGLTDDQVRWRPMLLGALFKAIGQANVPLETFSPAKQRYFRSELERLAADARAPYRWPSRFPMRTTTALRIALLLDGADRRRYSLRVFEAYWGEDRDISDEAVLGELVQALALPESLLERARSDESRQTLVAETSAAQAAGVFGAPTFVIPATGERFWGQDRLHLVCRALYS